MGITSKPNIISYFTLESILSDVPNLSTQLIKESEFTPRYLIESGKVYVLNEFLKRINKLRKREYIQTVLFLPFDEKISSSILNSKINLDEYFNRIYFSNKIKGDKSNYDTKIIMEKLNTLLKGNSYEIINSSDISPCIILYEKDERILKELIFKLKENLLCYSYYKENGYTKVYIDNIYQNLMKRDLVYNSNKSTFSMFTGNTKEGLRFTQEASIGIVPYEVIEYMGNHETNQLVSNISTMKIIETNDNNRHLYSLEACAELKAFVNKMIYS